MNYRDVLVHCSLRSDRTGEVLIAVPLKVADCKDDELYDIGEVYAQTVGLAYMWTEALT